MRMRVGRCPLRRRRNLVQRRPKFLSLLPLQKRLLSRAEGLEYCSQRTLYRKNISAYRRRTNEVRRHTEASVASGISDNGVSRIEDDRSRRVHNWDAVLYLHNSEGVDDLIDVPEHIPMIDEGRRRSLEDR